MRIFSIDTSSKTLSMAVGQKGQVSHKLEVRFDKMMSQALMPEIKEFMNKSGCDLKDMDGFVVGLGPGSFTSLRVGIAAMKGFAFALQKPLVGLSSLDAIAGNCTQEATTVCVLTDAKRSMVYSAVYAKKGQELNKIRKDQLSDINTALQGINGNVEFLGDGCALFENDLKFFNKSMGLNAVILSEETWIPRAENQMQEAYQLFQSGQVQESNQIHPLYLYPEDCMVTQKKKK